MTRGTISSGAADPFADIRIEVNGVRWLSFNFPVKQCSRCRNWRCSPQGFYKQGAAAQCKACLCEDAAQRRAADPEKARKAVRASSRLRRIADPNGVREYHSRWLDAHPGANTRYGRRWRVNNPERQNELSRTHNHRRRARALAAPGAHAADDIKRILSEKRCHICGGTRFTKSNPKTVDHIVALADGGSNDASNLALAHKSCNSAKRHSRFNPMTNQGFLL
jgi:hypothetical protein